MIARIAGWAFAIIAVIAIILGLKDIHNSAGDPQRGLSAVVALLSILLSICSFVYDASKQESLPEPISKSNAFEETGYSEPDRSIDDDVIPHIPASDSKPMYIIYDSDTRLLTKSDLQDLSEHECYLAMNEILARHGRIFSNDDIAEYFESQSWYLGTIEGTYFDANRESFLNSIENQNFWFIVDYQKEKGWRS